MLLKDIKGKEGGATFGQTHPGILQNQWLLSLILKSPSHGTALCCFSVESSFVVSSCGLHRYSGKLIVKNCITSRHCNQSRNCGQKLHVRFSRKLLLRKQSKHHSQSGGSAAQTTGCQSTLNVQMINVSVFQYLYTPTSCLGITADSLMCMFLKTHLLNNSFTICSPFIKGAQLCFVLSSLSCKGFCACKWSAKAKMPVSLPETPPLDSFVYFQNILTSLCNTQASIG